MGKVLSAACGLFVSLSAAATAQEQPAAPVTVVELYTSQGCSSCPPADEFMRTLVTDPRVIPLSLHVDYWDYIGWKDSFASPKFTDRQKSYAQAIGSRTIYTPQTIIGGLDRVEGHKPEEIVALIEKHSRISGPVTIWLDRNGDILHIRAEADPPLASGVRVQLVRYMPSAETSIKDGENAGQVITYTNIVTAWDMLGEWSGQEPLSISAPAKGDDPMVVILQNDGPTGIVAAAALR